MLDWLTRKLDWLTSEFRGGVGTPMIFELQFLCYLECYIVARDSNPADVWAEYEANCQKSTPEGDPVIGHFYRIKDRDELANVLETFRKKFNGSRKTSLKQPKKKTRAQKKPKPRSKDEAPDDGILGMFGVQGT